MAVSVYPERMDQIDPEDVEASLRTLETYIHYICERTEFALTNTFRTTNDLGESASDLSQAVETARGEVEALGGQVTDLSNDLDGKVDKVEGKGLSTNDYTDADKAALANKVDKVSGKGLSTNDYTNEDKNKLAGIEAGAQVNEVTAEQVEEITDRVVSLEDVVQTIPQLPCVIIPPEDATAAVNSTHSFHVVAFGKDLSYRWQYSANGGTTWTNSTAAGATTDTLTLSAIKTSWSGRIYHCIITDSAGGRVVSSAASLTVTS